MYTGPSSSSWLSAGVATDCSGDQWTGGAGMVRGRGQHDVDGGILSLLLLLCGHLLVPFTAPKSALHNLECVDTLALTEERRAAEAQTPCSTEAAGARPRPASGPRGDVGHPVSPPISARGSPRRDGEQGRGQTTTTTTTRRAAALFMMRRPSQKKGRSLRPACACVDWYYEDEDLEAELQKFAFDHAQEFEDGVRRPKYLPGTRLHGEFSIFEGRWKAGGRGVRIDFYRWWLQIKAVDRIVLGLRKRNQHRDVAGVVLK